MARTTLATTTLTRILRPNAAHHHRATTNPLTTATAATWTLSSSRSFATEKYSRDKPHVNIGTIGHVLKGPVNPPSPEDKADITA
eukprot:scaffold173576_cov18-Cyclotella_meneghiniana.AAC.1